MAINPGYMGYASVSGAGSIRFESANLAVKQEVSAPDLIMGDMFHDSWNYGPITVGGTISGPVSSSFASVIWPWATARGTCGELTSRDMTVYYYCGAGGRNSRPFQGVLVNSVNFSCSAGDIAKFSLDVMGAGASPWSTYGGGYTTAEKLLTWDKVGVTVAGMGTEFSAFDFTLSNNCTPAYNLGQPTLFPYQIVPGLVTITGSLSVYNVPTADGADTWDSYVATGTSNLTFNIGGTAITFKVVFHRVEPTSATGPMISTVNFTGVTHQTY